MAEYVVYSGVNKYRNKEIVSEIFFQKMCSSTVCVNSYKQYEQTNTNKHKQTAYKQTQINYIKYK